MFEPTRFCGPQALKCIFGEFGLFRRFLGQAVQKSVGFFVSRRFFCLLFWPQKSRVFARNARLCRIRRTEERKNVEQRTEERRTENFQLPTRNAIDYMIADIRCGHPYPSNRPKTPRYSRPTGNSRPRTSTVSAV